MPHVGDDDAGAARTGGVHAVGEQDDEHLALGVDPERGAGIAYMSVRAVAQILARAALAGRDLPSECAMIRDRCDELAHRLLAHEPRAVVLAAVEHHLREHGQVGRRTEQPGMARHATECERGFVGDLATHGVAAGRGHLGGRDA